ncbi:hypothetical protein KAJ89_05120 [Candidatus Parcubacteria bacterium]|nr:hypothetical protein [Candidatus Parcubacteria bacterium]
MKNKKNSNKNEGKDIIVIPLLMLISIPFCNLHQLSFQYLADLALIVLIICFFVAIPAGIFMLVDWQSG